MNPQRLPLPMDTSHQPPPPAAPDPAAQQPPPEAATAGPPAQLTPEAIAALEEQIQAVLQTCYDPEIPVNIYELGLIYDIDIDPTGAVYIRMTLTSPACPVAGSLPPEVEAKVRSVPGVTSAKVEVVWDPIWNQDMMSEAARLQLGLF